MKVLYVKTTPLFSSSDNNNVSLRCVCFSEPRREPVLQSAARATTTTAAATRTATATATATAAAAEGFVVDDDDGYECLLFVFFFFFFFNDLVFDEIRLFGSGFKFGFELFR